MVKVCLRHRAAQQFQRGQQHGTQRPEQILERRVAPGTFRQTLYQRKKFFRHEELLHRQRIFAAEQFKQLAPVGRGAPYQVQQRPALGIGKGPFHRWYRVRYHGFIQKIFPDFGHIGGDRVAELPPLPAFRPDGYNDKLMFGHPLHQNLYPGRHTAHHIGVTPLHDQTDFHAATSLMEKLGLSTVTR